MKKRIIEFLKANKIELLFLALIIILASFLRFYKINELHFFTYDQARDDLIVKRILVDHKFTLLGPQSSMRGVYLPPFYYYTLVPILWLSGLNPVGVDVYTALIGVLTVLLLWWVVREFFGRIPALIIAALYATSPLIVELSHRAWNPNTQPFFILLFLYLLYKLFKTKKEKFLVFSSLVYGYVINLHYGSAALFPIWVFAFIWGLVKLKRKSLVFLSLFLLFLFGAPLILFDLRHDFMLSNNIYLHFFAGDRMSISPYNFLEPMVASIYQLFVALLSGSFIQTAQVPFEFWGKLKSVLTFAPVSIIAHKPLLVQYQWWGLGLFISIIFSTVWFYIKKKKVLILNLLLSFILVSAFISRLYTGKFYFFYYIFIYIIPFLFLGLFFYLLWQKRIGKILAILIFILMFSFNLKHVLVFEKPERIIDDIQRISKVIAEDIDETKTFNLMSNYHNPDRWDHNAVDYRYFIEAFYGKRGLDWQPEDYKKAEILYVIAEGGLPDPINTQIMEIYEFKPKEILDTWELEDNVIIYKLGK